MAEDLHITQGDKKAQYESLIPQIKALIEGETNQVANLANISAALKEQFGWWWVGFYMIIEDELVLGPFQGPIACTRIAKGKGVCGMAWERKTTLVVPNVHEFEGHIACSSLSNSEIVVPVFTDGEIVAVLDVDSIAFGTFDEVDAFYLKNIAAWFVPLD